MKTGINIIVVLPLACLIFGCHCKHDKVKLQQKLSGTLPCYDEADFRQASWNEFGEGLRAGVGGPSNPDYFKNGTSLDAKDRYSHSKFIQGDHRRSTGRRSGQADTPFEIYPNATGHRIVAIALRAASLIDRLTVAYADHSGNMYVGGNWGSTGKFHIQYFEEGQYILTVTGRTGQYIDRFGVHTNRTSLEYGACVDSIRAVGQHKHPCSSMRMARI